MKNLLIVLAVAISSVSVSASWTDYLNNDDYVVGYGFAGHKSPMLMDHPHVYFIHGGTSTNAHETCIEGNEIRTITPRTFCVEREKEMELVTSKKDEDEKILKWTGDYVCVRTATEILRKPLYGTKEICENRQSVIADWKKANEDESYNYGDYPKCTLKRTVSANATKTFKIFVAEKAQKSDKNYEDDFNKNWNGYPLFSQMWTIPACR